MSHPYIPIHQLFEHQTITTPHSTAVVFTSTDPSIAPQQLTYYELNARANQLARTLQRRGVGPEVLVGVCLDRSLEIVVAVLAVFKAGGAYVPLDPAYPQERLAYMLADSRVPILLTQSHLVDDLPEHTAQTLSLDTDWAWISQEDPSNLDLRIMPEQLAYIIYTSGSTGKPKGVQVEHRGLGYLAAGFINSFDVHPDSIVLQFSSLSFDACVPELLMALLSGGCLCIASRESLIPGPNLISILRDQKITTVILPPSVLAALPHEPLPSLHTLIVAGEACPAELVQRWGTDRNFVNAYGPTEGTVCATFGHCTPDGKRPSIGYAMEHVQIVLLSESLQPIAPDEPGEICIGGLGLARGYLNQPELTAARFITYEGTRLYRTGDLARMLPDGSFDYLGRLDHQVKIRGVRIELGEIEAMLGKHPMVHHCIVLARDDVTGIKRLVAYVIPHIDGTQPPSEKATPTEAEQQLVASIELRAHLRHFLPDTMLPAAFVFLDALPLTPNGKVDRAALPVPTDSLFSATALPLSVTVESAPTMHASSASAEEILAFIWSEMFHVPTINRHDNFFELGGDSILGIQMIVRAHAVGLEIAPRQLFRHPTIAELAAIARITQDTQADQNLADSGEAVQQQNATNSALVAQVPDSSSTPVDIWEQELNTDQLVHLAMLLDNADAEDEEEDAL